MVAVVQTVPMFALHALNNVKTAQVPFAHIVEFVWTVPAVMVGAITATTVVSVYNYVPAVKVALNVLKFARNVVKAAETVLYSALVAVFVRIVQKQTAVHVHTVTFVTPVQKIM